MSSDPRLVVPYVTEQSPRGERTMDIYSRLLRERIIFLGTPVMDEVADSIVAQLLFLDMQRALKAKLKETISSLESKHLHRYNDEKYST